MIFMSREWTVVKTLVAPCTTISLFSGMASGVHQATNTGSSREHSGSSLEHTNVNEGSRIVLEGPYRAYKHG